MKLIIKNTLFNEASSYIQFKNDSKSFLLLKNRNYYWSFFLKKCDCLFIDNRNSVILKYLNMPRFKYITSYYPKEKTSILLLHCNASLGISIGDVLFFESEHII